MGGMVPFEVYHLLSDERKALVTGVTHEEPHGDLVEPDPDEVTFDQFATEAVLLAHQVLKLATDKNDPGATARIYARLVIEHGTTFAPTVCHICGHDTKDDGDGRLPSPTHEAHLRAGRS